MIKSFCIYKILSIFDISMNDKGRKMENLTDRQRQTYESLIRLGDSPELALKTVLEMVKDEEPSQMYQIAYYS